MGLCTFFGHKDTPDSVYPELLHVIREMILHRGITDFMVGNHGIFDSMVLKSLRELKKRYPYICYYVVLAYMPGGKREYEVYAPEETVLPEGIERVPKRFSIAWRNQWMVQQSQVVICYVTHGWGGAAKAVEYAKKQGKELVFLGKRL